MLRRVPAFSRGLGVVPLGALDPKGRTPKPSRWGKFRLPLPFPTGSRQPPAPWGALWRHPAPLIHCREPSVPLNLTLRARTQTSRCGNACENHLALQKEELRQDHGKQQSPQSVLQLPGHTRPTWQPGSYITLCFRAAWDFPTVPRWVSLQGTPITRSWKGSIRREADTEEASSMFSWHTSLT